MNHSMVPRVSVPSHVELTLVLLYYRFQHCSGIVCYNVVFVI